jgi:4-amino-4-deoxy-L-arabinose transferase-like glycosyltransferase
MRNRAAVQALVMIALLTLVGIFDHELWTPDEPRDAEISREIGFRALPTLNGEPHVEKPPLYFWSVHASYQVFGAQAWSARVPSVLFSWGTLIFTWLLACRMFGPGAAWRACLFVATTVVYFLVTHKCTVDNALVFMTTGCFYWLYQAQASEAKLRYYFLAYLFAAGAVLAKGAVGAGLAGATFLVFVLWERRPMELLRAQPWLAVAIIAAVAGAWLLSLPPAARHAFLIENQWGRLSGAGTADHLQPFWYYGAAFFYALAPWGLATLPAVPWILRRDDDTRAKRYLVACILPGLLLLSLAATNRELYLLPLAPATAILAAGWFERASARVRTVTDRAVLAFAIVFVAAVIAAVPALDREKSLAPFVRALPPEISRVPAFRPDETTLAVIPFYSGRSVVPFESLGDALRAAEAKPAWLVVVLKSGRDAVPDELKASHPCVWPKHGERGRRMILLSNVER